MTLVERVYKFANRMWIKELNGSFIRDFNRAFRLKGTEDEVYQVIYQMIEMEPCKPMVDHSYILHDSLRGITELCVLEGDDRVVLHVHQTGDVLLVPQEIA